MPLKEPDLKDTDTYKKASRADLPKVVSGNAKFWIYKDVELPNPSGKKQKYPAFLALVDDNGIRKAMSGKKVICKGTCGIKEDRIAFEPSTGPVPYKMLKASVPLLLGKAVWIPTGTEEDGEEEAGETAAPAASGSAAAATPPPAVPPPPKADSAPPVSAASLAGAWSKLTKDVQAFAIARPERKAELVRDMSVISGLLKENQAAEAKSKMDKMQSLLDAPPAAPPAEQANPAQAAARWGALVKEMQAAISAHPEKKAELVRVSAGMPELIRAGKLDLAAKQMETIETALKENPREKEYRARYRAIEGRLAVALKDPARDASRLRAMSAFILERAGAGDFETALKALLKLEEALAAKPAAAPGEAKKGVEEEDEAEAADGEEEDEEEQKEAAEFQKDLKGKMVTALAQVKARAPREGQEPKPQLRFMAYLAGKSNAVIVAKRVGSGSKKLLAKIADASGGKIVLGECIFEKGVYTFVSAKVPGGLAKKLTMALLAETGTKYRVRARAIDGSVDLDSETDVDPDSTPAAEPQARWGALVKQMQAIVAANPEKKAALVRASAGIADMIRAGKLDLANRLMDRVDATIQENPQEAPGAAREPELRSQWAAAKQTWLDCLEKVDRQINAVKGQMAASGDPDFKLIADRGLPALTGNHKTPVMRALFELDGPPGDARKGGAGKAQAAITAFRAHLRSSHLIHALDEHAQVAFGVQMTLQTEIERGLSALERTVRVFAGA